MEAGHGQTWRRTLGPSLSPEPETPPSDNFAKALWSRLDGNVQGAVMMSLGALLLVVMSTLVKELGQRLDSFQILFIRALFGFLVVAPLLMRNGFHAIRTERAGLHLFRGGIGALGNFCFFFALTHMVLADAMAIQFSRPLFTIVLAYLFLGEVVGWRRATITMIGFTGILLITRPFSEGFEPVALIAALGALLGTGVVIAIKKLARSEKTMVIMFYYAMWTTIFSAIPAALVWQQPSWHDVGLLSLVGILGIAGQTAVTHGISLGDTTFVVPFDYLRVVFAVIFGIALFAEIPTLWSISGTAIIIGSNLYLLRRGAKVAAAAGSGPGAPP